MLGDQTSATALRTLQEENLMLKSEIATLKGLVDKGTKDCLKLTATVARLEENIKALLSTDPRETLDKSLQESALKAGLDQSI